MTEGNVFLDIEEIDKYQFVDMPITITANLLDSATNQHKLGETSNIKVLLAFEGNASVEHRCREHHPNLLEVLSNTGIREDGKAKIEIKIKDVSMNHENQKFVIYLEAYRPHGENNIICAISNPITCVRHKLVLSEAYSSPYIWYKDEGAKDKCIRILVKLIDGNKNLVKDRNIVLVPTLIYSSGLPVQPANVLNLFHDRDKPFIVSQNGTEVVRFRVNEVSRNHRKQLFHLLIAPDLSLNPSAADISPAVSLAFEVKSKRTSDAKREQQFLRNDDDSEEEGPALTPGVLKANSNEATFGDHTTVLNNLNHKISSLISSSIRSSDGDANKVTPRHSLTISPRAATTETKNTVIGNKRVHSATDPRMSLTGPDNEANPEVPSFEAPARNSSSLPPSRDGDGNKSIPVSMQAEESNIDTPLQALTHVMEWMNASFSALSSVKAARNSTNKSGNSSSNGASTPVSSEIEELISQLLETFPIRTLSSMHFLQQFLAIHENYLVQQNQLVFQFYQQQQQLNAFPGIHQNSTPRTLAYSMGRPPPTGMTSGYPTNFAIPSPLAAISQSGRSGKVDGPSPARGFRSYPLADHLMSRFPRNLAYGDLKRRRYDSSAAMFLDPTAVSFGGLNHPSGAVPTGMSSFESFITVVVAKYIKLVKVDKEMVPLGIPAFCTVFPPIRLVGFYQKNHQLSNSSSSSSEIRGEWSFRPLQSIAVLNDNEIAGNIYDEIVDMLENVDIVQNGCMLEIGRYQNNLSVLKADLFQQFEDFDHEHSRGDRLYLLKPKKSD